MKTILVIGASGFVGRQLTKALLADGFVLRCPARDPARVQDLATTGCEIVQGDLSDLPSVQRAVESVQAVYISIHTLSPQPNSGASPRFMEVEKNGLQNVIAACRSCGVRRVIYVTSLGTSPDEPSEWLRERWHAEQLLLKSGLDATVVRPGMIVGVGGRGFDTTVRNANRRFSIALGGNRPRMRTIALEDLIYYLVGVLDDARAYRQTYDVGNDDVLSINQLIDTTADILGRRHPIKIQIPLALLGALAPLIERIGKLPGGAMKGLVDAMKVDAVGDPLPIRTILPRPRLSFRQAVEGALAIK
ncbi:MAG TPA: NAD(P)H-binding protein [Chthoniobacterales bacterium]